MYNYESVRYKPINGTPAGENWVCNMWRPLLGQEEILGYILVEPVRFEIEGSRSPSNCVSECATLNTLYKES